MLRRVRTIAIALALLLGGALPMAWAARQTQGRVRQVKACVGLIPTLGEPGAVPQPLPDPDAIFASRSPNPNPYLFYVLDQRKDLKPDGWEFVNPAAPAFVTVAQATRWDGRIQPGQPLKKDMAAYWEVALSPENYSRLAQMDIIYIPISRNPTHFTENQRRLLTRLADSGVTIWVDWAVQAPTPDGALGGPVASTKNFFFTNLDFQQVAGGVARVPVDPVTNRPISHPLIESEYYLVPAEAEALGLPLAPNASPAASRAVSTRPPSVQVTANFTTVVAHTGVNPAGGGYVVATPYGSGFIVATAGNVGGAIAGMIAPTTPSVSLPDMSAAQPEDLKFAYNMVAWRAEVAAQQKDTRHTAQTGVQLNGLIEQSTYPSLVRSGGPGQPWIAYPPQALSSLPVNPVSPLIVNGVVVSYTRWVNPATGQTYSELNAFDADPTSDFDLNDYIDDPVSATNPATHPLADVSIGQPYDRLMTLGPDSGVANLPLLRGMTVGQVPDGASPGGSKGFLFVAGMQGGPAPSGLFSVPAPRPGMPASDFWAPATITAAPDLNIDYTAAPAYVNIPGPIDAAGNPTPLGQLFAGGNVSQPLFGSSASGKLAAFNVSVDPSRPAATAMTPAWYYPPNGEGNRMGSVSGPVVVAQVQDEGSGAIDTMVFVTSVSSGQPTAGQNPQGAGDTTGKVDGFIVATRGDVLTFPRGNNAPGGGNPQAGRRFVCARWLDFPPGLGAPPQPRELMWDPTKHVEVRVMDRDQNYVLWRYVGTGQLRLLPDGTGGQVELPPPPPQFQAPGQPGVWDLNRFVLVADYSPLPQDVDNGGKTIRPRFTPPTPYYRDGQQNIVPTGIAGGVAVGKDNLIYYGTGQGYLCAAEWRRGRAGFRWKMRGAFGDGSPPLTSDNAGMSSDVNPVTSAGAPNPDYLLDYVFVATPAAGDRIVFASRGRGGAGTVYILEPDAVIRFKLFPSTDSANRLITGTSLTEAQAKEVMLKADHGQGVNPSSPFLLSTMQPWGRAPGQFRVDADTATVTFENMENFALDLTQVRSPAEMAAMGIDTGGRPAVPIQWCLRKDPENSGRFPTLGSSVTAWIPLPLVAVYRSSYYLPNGGRYDEKWLSGPVIAGDRIYLMGDSGLMHELPLDPRAVDPQFPRPAPGLTGFDLGNTALYAPNGLRRLRNVAFIPGQSSYHPSPAISQGLMAVASGRGLTLYHSPNIVIADSNRIVEASGDSFALANTDVVTKHHIVGAPGVDSDFPVPSDPNYAQFGGTEDTRSQIAVERKLLSRPAVVRKLDRRSSLTSVFLSTAPTLPPTPGVTPGIRENSDLAEESYLAADTGNDRCVEFNPAGKVVWEAKRFQDPFGLLPGEPLSLSGPMDVQRWIELEAHPTLGLLYVVHTLIADTGNTRILELVDKVVPQQGAFNARSYAVTPDQTGADGQPIRWYHVLVWASQTNAQGLKLRYRTAQRIFWTDATGGLIPTANLPNTPLPAETTPPYLPPERFFSTTMAAVTGQQLVYPDAAPMDYFQTYPNPPSQAVLDRRPLARPGGDSIVFLRGRWTIDPPRSAPRPTPFREPRVDRGGNTVANQDSYRFGQGVIDPSLPIITEIFDEMVRALPSGSQEASPNTVHRLNGITSVQRTVRADVKFAPESYGNAPMPRGVYFLVADTDGVWEFRMLPSDYLIGLLPAPNRPPVRQFRLTLAFTNDDYHWVTGGAVGKAGRLLSAASARRLPNGLILVASRTPANALPPVDPMGAGAVSQRYVGADVFLLRAAHYRTAAERGGTPYDRSAVAAHGWIPDLWAQTPMTQGPPSIRWRAAEALDPAQQPTPRTLLQAGGNPYELTGTYVPVQPNYADLAE